MTWLQRYRVRHYLRNSVWVAPVIAMVTAMIGVRVLHPIEEAFGWYSSADPENLRAALGTLAGAMFTFIVFVCSSLLLVVQLASAQLSPRIIGTMLRDRVTKLTLAVFVFTFTFVLSAMGRIEPRPPQLITQVAIYSCALSVAVFLYLIDHVAKMLRPSGAFKAVASEAHVVIEKVYPRRLADASEGELEPSELAAGQAPRIVPSTASGVVLAFDEKGLVALAKQYDCLIELAPQVGNFTAPGDPLFRIYGGADLPAGRLYSSIALGAERTMEQDPAFAFRVIVDIASKGLSPAINDPTTAVLAIDRIHHLLRHLGNRRLDNENIRDATGRVRLLYRTPDWEDFVALAVTEIRQFGGTSIQIARRMRAMLENLIQTLPDERAEVLRQELKLLNQSAQRFFVEPEDRALAAIGDSQGVGGKHESQWLRKECHTLPGD